MGELYRQTLETTNKGAVHVHCGFQPNAGSSPTAAMIYGNAIASVARTGAGTYTVTLKPEYKNLDLIAKHISLQLAAAGDSKAIAGPYVKAAATQQVFTITGAAAADIANNADNIVWLSLVFRTAIVNDGTLLYDS